MILPRLPSRTGRTPDFKIVQATEPTHDSGSEVAIQKFRDGLLVEPRAPVTCFLCAVVTFGISPGQRRPAAFCIISRDSGLEVRGICSGCLNKEPSAEWLAGRVNDQLAREGRAARAKGGA
jgi:hypothetical protein